MEVELYNRFAERYDLVTAVASWGIEPIWRSHFAERARKLCNGGVMVDVAAATGEVARKVCCPKTYLVDPSSRMLAIARLKLARKCPGRRFFYIRETAESVELPEKVDLIAAFMAVRNFDNLEMGISNLARYLKKGGYFYIVEMVNRPTILGKLGVWYLKRVVPYIGKVLTGRGEEFKPLGESVEKLREEQILKGLEKAGLKVVEKGYLFPPVAVSIIAQK
jgi:ubiquinone/menaquinone biosynthesis C-methylase UbiE